MIHLVIMNVMVTEKVNATIHAQGAATYLAIHITNYALVLDEHNHLSELR
jgi:hypothetical protein